MIVIDCPNIEAPIAPVLNTPLSDLYDSEDFINFCGLLRKHELYKTLFEQKVNVFIPNRITLGTFQITLKFLKIAFILYFVY